MCTPDGIITVQDAEGTPATVVQWDGMYYPAFKGVCKRLEGLKSFMARDDDILLASYPKSGTHWVQSIISMLLRSSTDHIDQKEIKVFLEARDDPETVAPPRILVTHVPHRHIPPDIFKNNVKIVVVYRNPKDTAVSLFHFYRNNPRYQYNGTWNGFYSLFVRDKVIYGSWYEYILTWWNKEKNNPNVLFVSYEDMKKDCLFHIKTISKFLGLKQSDEFLREVEQQCSFSVMKEVNGSTVNTVTGVPQHVMYRKGEVGDWKNHFTVTQNEEFNIMHEIKMKNSDLVVQFNI